MGNRDRWVLRSPSYTTGGTVSGQKYTIAEYWNLPAQVLLEELATYWDEEDEMSSAQTTSFGSTRPTG